MNADEAREAVLSAELGLSSIYDNRRLSDLLQRDALDARSIPGAADLVYQLDDFARHADRLEVALELAQDALQDVADVADELEDLREQVKDLEHDVDAHDRRFLDKHARDEVERELHIAGIIEDPDVDGGLPG